jgi:predicted amidohydrolase YtcJ
MENYEAAMLEPHLLPGNVRGTPLIDPADIPRFRELGVVANFQPLWAFADSYITDLTIPFIGPQRSAGLYPIGSVHRSGGVVAFGTGSVEVGKLADLIVLDQNLFAIPPEKISDTQALVTLFEGKAVHGDLGNL